MYESEDVDGLNGEIGAAPGAGPQGAPPAERPGPRAVATRIAIRPGREAAFAAWQAAFTRAISGAPGFVSLDMLPAFPAAAEWQIVQRFHTADALDRWLTQGARAGLLRDLAALDGPGSRVPVDEAAPDFHSTTTVTEVITTLVRPGQEDAFRTWAERIQREQARFPGYMGTLVQGPAAADAPWTTLVRFESSARLDAWLGSEERRALIAEAAPTVSTWRSHRMTDAFSAWFANERRQAPPPAWKQTSLVLLVLFPIVMLEIRFLSPLLGGLHVALATFIGNAVSVSLVSWPLMALAVAALGWWLRPAPVNRRRTEVLGVAAVAGLYAVELLVFTQVM